MTGGSLRSRPYRQKITCWSQDQYYETPILYVPLGGQLISDNDSESHTMEATYITCYKIPVTIENNVLCDGSSRPSSRLRILSSKFKQAARSHRAKLIRSGTCLVTSQLISLLNKIWNFHRVKPCASLTWWGCDIHDISCDTWYSMSFNCYFDGWRNFHSWNLNFSYLDGVVRMKGIVCIG